MKTDIWKSIMADSCSKWLFICFVAYVCLLILMTTVYRVGLPQARSPVVSQTELLNRGIRASSSSGLFVLETGVILAILMVIWLAARLSEETYVRRWTAAWVVLLFYYVYRSVLSFIPQVTLDAAKSWLEFLFLVPSTGFILLTGLHLLPKRESDGKIKELRIFMSLILVVALSSVILSTVLSLQDAVALADGAMGCVCLVFTGWRLALYAPSRKTIPGGAEVFPLFFLYGLLQLASPWKLGHDKLVFGLALLLKVPCSLSVVAIASRYAFDDLSRTRDRYREARDSLLNTNRDLEETKSTLDKRNAELGEALVLAKEASSATLLRERVFKDLGSLIVKTDHISSALDLLLKGVLEHLNSSRGFLVVRCDHMKDSRQFYALAAFTGITPSPELLGFDIPSQDREQATSSIRDRPRSVGFSDFVYEASWFHQQKFASIFSEGSVILPFPFSPPSQEAPKGWLVAEIRADNDLPDLSVRGLTLAEALNRLSIGLDLVVAKEIVELNSLSRNLLAKAKSMQERLDRLAELAAKTLNAERSSIDITEQLYYAHRHASWPPSSEGEIHGVSMYPEVGRTVWIRPEPPTQSGRMYFGFESCIDVPIKDLDDHVIGLLRCEDKRHAVEHKLPLPFNSFDFHRLEVIAEGASFTIERDKHQRTIEVLLAKGVHELRNPVGSLRQIVRWLQREKYEIGDSLFVKRLQDAAVDIETLRSMVDLVDINRGASKEIAVPIEVFGVIVMKTVAQLQARLLKLGFSEENIYIKVSDVGRIPTLKVKPTGLQRIVDNLIDNAVKYHAGEEFRMVIVGDVDRSHYIIRFRDWGIGVPSGWEERIFGDGARAPNAVDRSVTGQGLGLHIARELATGMGAELRLANRKHPTEFVILFPRGLRA